MEVYSKLVKPVSEVKYLQAENADRYRVIIRHFFNEYENIQYWLFRDDVYQMMNDTKYFQDYTIEKCQADLDALVEWGNLTAIQDTSKVHSIEEFKNKKFRYQLNEYTVEIERMILKIENLEVEGASLEPSLLERLTMSIRSFPKILEKSIEDISAWWRDVNTDFIRLNQNYQDYLKTLNSQRAEELMQSEEFLIYKDQLISYLRNFVVGLQRQGSILEAHLRNVKKEDVDTMVAQVLKHEIDIPRLDRKISEEDLKDSIHKRWDNILQWFVPSGSESELNRLYTTTNEVIRKITRYAQQISELKHRNANRKQEYRHIADMFAKCTSILDAHLLSAQVFGVQDMFHLLNIQERTTESMDSGVYEEKSTMIQIEPRTRVARKTTTRAIPKDYELEKRMAILELEAEIEKQQKLLKSLIKEETIALASLPKISGYTRNVLLSWISKALQNEDRKAKTEFGSAYEVIMPKANEPKCEIHCEDGVFISPAFTIVFEEN